MFFLFVFTIKIKTYFHIEIYTFKTDTNAQYESYDPSLSYLIFATITFAQFFLIYKMQTNIQIM